MSNDATLTFKGSANFRQRLILSILSGRAIKIEDIRSMNENPGVRDYEASFLRLLDKVTNGTKVRINETGTTLRFKPGLLTGGSRISHECPSSRSISYYIEALVCLAPFAKMSTAISFTGVTNEDKDIAIDLIRTVTFPMLERFGLDRSGMEVKVVKRGAAPGGGGEVYFKCPMSKTLKPIDWLEDGKVKRIRGVAWTTKVSPQTANRMVDSARGILNNYIPDVYIYSDHYKGRDSGVSPGFGISLAAETTEGVLISAQRTASKGELPEDIGAFCANLLCQEIAAGGVVDSCHQWMVCLLMALCPEDVSRVRVGKLSPLTISFLRLMREVFGITFKLAAEEDTNTVIMSCLGIGYKNIARRTI